MFSHVIEPEEDGKPVSNQTIVDRLREEITSEGLTEAVAEEIVRQGVAEKVSLGASPAPKRPEPGQPEIPGVHFFIDNRTMFEDFRATFYGLRTSAEGEGEADAAFNVVAGEKEKRVRAHENRIEAVKAALAKIDDPIIKTEMETRLRQLGAEVDGLRTSRVNRPRSAANFIVAAALRLVDEFAAGKVEIRGLHAAARRSNTVIIDWGFVLIDLAKFEG